jgi:hypothetical protein
MSGELEMTKRFHCVAPPVVHYFVGLLLYSNGHPAVVVVVVVVVVVMAFLLQRRSSLSIATLPRCCSYNSSLSVEEKPHSNNK